MLQHFLISLGQGLPPGGMSLLEHEMTLIVALKGKHEVVIAADSIAVDGSNEGLYKFRLSKLRPVGTCWVLGAALTGIGFDLHSYIENEGHTFNPNIEIGVHEYAARMRELYEKHSYTGETAVLLGGVHNGNPSIYGWNLERSENGQVKFGGAMSVPLRQAIGANHHGALYFMNAYHSPEMDTSQRILVAYLSVREATKHDPRVGGNVEVALIRDKGVTFFTQEDLADVELASAGIADWLSNRLSAPGPRIGRL